MHSATALVSTVALLASQARLAYGAPAAGQLERRAVPCEPVSKYTTEFFTGKIIYDPPMSSCLFYTEYLTATAQRYAHGGGNDLTTIWDMWPCEYYNGDVEDEDNPLRCIFQKALDGDTSERTLYFENMSRAMALQCDLAATVMTKDVDNIPMNGIWGRVEFPTLIADNGCCKEVDTITAIDPQGNNAKTIWEREFEWEGSSRLAKREVEAAEGKTLAKRAQPNGCYDPETLQKWFGDVPW